MIASGTLERVLPIRRHEPHVIQAVHLSNRYIPRKVRVFVEGRQDFREHEVRSQNERPSRSYRLTGRVGTYSVVLPLLAESEFFPVT